MHLRSRLLSEQQFCIPICAHNCKKNEVKFSSQTISPRHASDYDTVHPRLSEPHLSESSFIRTHKYGCEYHYMLVNLINEYEYCLHVIHLSELFTYPNTFLRPVATGVRISEDALYHNISL